MLAHVIAFLVLISVVVSFVQAYLMVNRVWSRKHQREVAEAQSVASGLLSVATNLPFLANYALHREWKGLVVAVLWLLVTLFFLLVGVGYWVPSAEARPSLYQRLRRALRLERTEVGALAKAFLRPHDSSAILEILRRLATIDNQLDQKERAFLVAFATTWELELDLDAASTGHGGDYLGLRRTVERYLAGAPPVKQVAQLRDVMVALTEIDGTVGDDERIVLAELRAMIEAYVDGGKNAPGVSVVLVPQSPDQDDAIRSLLPDARRIAYRGGSAYVAGRYHAAPYAEVVRSRYEALNFFTVIDVGVDDEGAREIPAAALG
jgi:hypothetical protein